MDTLKQFVSTTVFATLLGSSSLAMAKNPNNWETVPAYDPPNEFLNEGVIIECLDNTPVDVLWENIMITYRAFETPSGNFQYVESWEWDATWTATDGSNRVWVGHGSSPGKSGFVPEKGEVVQYSSHEKVIPVGHDGPSLIYNWIFKFTVNANGELTAYIDPGSTMNDWNIRCVGPKKTKK